MKEKDVDRALEIARKFGLSDISNLLFKHLRKKGVEKMSTVPEYISDDCIEVTIKFKIHDIESTEVTIKKKILELIDMFDDVMQRYDVLYIHPNAIKEILKIDGTAIVETHNKKYLRISQGCENKEIELRLSSAIELDQVILLDERNSRDMLDALCYSLWRYYK